MLSGVCRSILVYIGVSESRLSLGHESGGVPQSFRGFLLGGYD